LPDARPHALAALLALLGAGPTCRAAREDDETSTRLRAAERKDAAPTGPAGGRTTPGRPAEGAAPAPAPAADPEVVLRGDPPPPDAPRARLRLALAPGAVWVVQTVGNVRYPMVASQVGFALEERIEVGSCEGTGDDRTCVVTRTLTALDAEGDGGRFIRTEQGRRLDHGIRARLDVRGRRVGPTTLDGPNAKTLVEKDPTWAQVHPLFCLRFPAEPVAKGAKWRHRCHLRDRDRVGERRVLWEVSEIEKDPAGEGLRVELRFVGSYAEPAPEGRREGTVQGIVYFHTGHGLPHVLQEQLSVTIAPDKGMRTVATLNRTFGRIEARGGNEVRTLIDGRPFPPGINARAAGDDEAATR